jgi:hypothetical protein
MYSLIITVKSINALYTSVELLLLSHYSTDVETSLSHGEEYVIPSLIWPPPLINTKSYAVGARLFISSRFGVNS